MTTYSITHDEKACIGCGACVSVCSENWEMADTGKSKIKKAKITDKELANNMEAATVCPVNCIHISDGKKKLV